MSMDVKMVTDEAFGVYGRVITGIDVDELINAMEQTPVPEGVIYEPSYEALEKPESYKKLAESCYGGMPVQAGYCNGHNNKLNAFEYHRCSEINIAVTDMILILGRQQDITQEYTYNTELAEAYYIPAKTVVEMYATTLHYAPCDVEGKGFKCIVILPEGTNTQLSAEMHRDEDKCLFARNKWLIAHKDACIDGAWEGLIGENLQL